MARSHTYDTSASFSMSTSLLKLIGAFVGCGQVSQDVGQRVCLHNPLHGKKKKEKERKLVRACIAV